ncbi:MFS transporter [Hydrogenoanaerobacterium sp.]|uniref:MFS transporter n=1 Tax=Hydrogenoanaerobacterium sp. TaxID=2953763 RepID=UPI00289818BD|nr:MFS transporter [Hydrogenoanaerobacterium sp.]
MKNILRKENIGFIAVQSLYQISFCVYSAFLVMYLQMNGFTNEQCGLAITLQYLTCLILQPLYGYITDTYLSCKRFLMLATAITIPAAFLLPMTVRIVPLAMLSIVIYACFYNSNETIIAAWVLLLRDQKPYINYEVTRGFASFFYAFFALGFGVLLQRFGTKVMFISYALLASALFLACIPIPEVACQNSKKLSRFAGGQSLSTLQVAKTLASNKPYMLFLASALCYQIGLKATKTFISNYVAVLGGAEQELGVLFFFSALIEFPALYLIGRMTRRYKVEYSYLMIQFALICNLLFLKFMPSMVGMTFAMIFSGVAYIGFLGVFMDFVKLKTPRQLNSSAISLGMALTNALGAILGAYFGGLIIDLWGLDFMTISCFITTALAFILFLPLLLCKDHTPTATQ